MTARQLTIGDLDDIAALYAALDPSTPADVGQVHTILDHPGTTMWGCVRQDRVLSMVTLHILPNATQRGRPYALIENVVTLTEFEGQGAGRIAMEAAMGHAWAEACYKIMLLTGKGTGARGFYERLGFRTDDKLGMQIRRVPPRPARH